MSPDRQQQEAAFRRGFRDGAEALAYAMGCPVQRFRRSAWCHRIKQWQALPLDQMHAPPHWLTPEELAGLLREADR